MEIKKLEAAIEAVLFTMGESVELTQIASAIQQDKETTRKLLNNMMDRYQEEDRGIQIIELEQSYQMCTKKRILRMSDPSCPASQETGTDRCHAGDTFYYRVQTAGHKGRDREDPRGKM